MLSSELDLSSTSENLDGGGFGGGNSIMSIASVASSCTLCVIFFVLIGVIANKNHCKNKK
jgi:hypothetical protein